MTVGIVLLPISGRWRIIGIMKDGINQCGGSGIESVDHFDGVGIVRIRPVVNKVEIKRAKRLIVEQIPHLADIEFPKRPVEDDGTLRPLFIGAFSKDGLIGAAFVTPGIQAAQSFLGYFSASAGAYQCAELVRRTVAEVEGIAVVDEYRRRGVALALKRYIDAWAADHGACLVLSVPTNETARGLNEKSGHRVLEPDVLLMLQVVYADGGPCSLPFALERGQEAGYSCWAFLPIAKPGGMSVRAGQCPSVASSPGVSGEEYFAVKWETRDGDGNWIATTSRLRGVRADVMD
ncbi:GNAT family N-acetyltransferase [Bifidobacterium longum]|uniref:GNAT family N-acetyltransferase n=1 Tax=Bifidobacterium longum TaxID=216816 RepID=UPI00398D12EA